MSKFKNIIDKKTKRDYNLLFQVRAAERNEEEQESGKMIVEGRAVVYDERTILFVWDNLDYGEIIHRGAFDNTDSSQCFFKFNHDSSKVMARTKNGTLELIDKDDGLYVRAEIVNTTEGRDLYEMIRSGLIDKMSFAFNETEEDFDEDSRTWNVRKIGKLWDVSAVTHPAYDDTELHSLRFDEVESSRLQALEEAKRNKLNQLSERATKLQENIKKNIRRK